MVRPKVSIIWLNHNSASFMNIVLESLGAIIDLDYPDDRYELIVVDNGSTDGSFEKIKSFLNTKSIRKRVIKLSKNLGFVGGNNIGFKARDPDSKYVVLLNNDAIPAKDSLTKLVEYAEQHERVGALAGTLLFYGSNLISSAGVFLDELLIAYHIGERKLYPWILRKPFYVSYVIGAYALYRVDYVKRCIGERLFIDEFFAYGDDNVICLMLWDCGFQTISIPEMMGYHVGGSTLGRVRTLSVYLVVRNAIALTMLSNSRYKSLALALQHVLKGPIGWIVHSPAMGGLYSVLVRAIYDGLKLGRELEKKMKKRLNIYKAPLVLLKSSEIFQVLINPRRRRDLIMERKIEELINILAVE